MVLTDAEGNDIWRGDMDGFEGNEEEDDEIVYEDEDFDEVLTASEFRTQRQVAHVCGWAAIAVDPNLRME